MKNLENLEIFAWRLWVACKKGEEIQGLNLGVLKLGEIQSFTLDFRRLWIPTPEPQHTYIFPFNLCFLIRYRRNVPVLIMADDRLF
jgi:hypothetical protein